MENLNTADTTNDSSSTVDDASGCESGIIVCSLPRDLRSAKVMATKCHVVLLTAGAPDFISLRRLCKCGSNDGVMIK